MQWRVFTLDHGSDVFPHGEKIGVQCQNKRKLVEQPLLVLRTFWQSDPTWTWFEIFAVAKVKPTWSRCGGNAGRPSAAYWRNTRANLARFMVRFSSLIFLCISLAVLWTLYGNILCVCKIFAVQSCRWLTFCQVQSHENDCAYPLGPGHYASPFGDSVAMKKTACHPINKPWENIWWWRSNLIDLFSPICDWSSSACLKTMRLNISGVHPCRLHRVLLAWRQNRRGLF